jgi:hypothetical protein
MTRLVILLVLTLALVGCDSLGAALAPIDETADHPVPEGLADPDLWIYLPPPADRPASHVTRWVKPAETAEERAQRIADAAAAGKPVPRPRYRGVWVEQFEYRTLERPRTPPAEYPEIFKKRMQRNCPDAVTTPLRIDGAEVLLEVVTSGCEPFGDEDELLRVLFDQPDFIELGYTVKASAMTPAQRAAGMAALYDWKTSF